MSVKPYRGPFSSFLMESSPAWIFIVGIVCVVVTPMAIWLRMQILDAGPVDLFELQGGRLPDSPPGRFHHPVGRSSTNDAIKTVFPFVFGTFGLVTGVLAALLPMWAAARLVADAVRDSGAGKGRSAS